MFGPEFGMTEETMGGEERNYGELKVSFAYRFIVSSYEIIKHRS